MQVKLILVFALLIADGPLKQHEAQNCSRPEIVHLIIEETTNPSLLGAIRDQRQLIYLQDSTEIFERVSEVLVVPGSNFDKLRLFTVKELREREIEIVKCESKSEKAVVYVDADINSVFENIQLVTEKDQKHISFKVRWLDYLE